MVLNVAASFQVLPPTVYLRVTENIPQIISFIEGIIAHGHAYSTDSGSVKVKTHGWRHWWGSEMEVTPGLMCADTSPAMSIRGSCGAEQICPVHF